MSQEAAVSVLAVMEARDRAWVDRPALEQSVGSDTVAELVGAGWLEVWDATPPPGSRVVPGTESIDVPTGEALTLTPWAAERLGVRLTEHWEFRSVKEPAGPKEPTKLVTRRGAVAVEEWQPEGRPDRPCRLPRHAREVPLQFPELVPDHRPGPEYLIDPVSEEPLIVFGQPVRIDRRMTRGRRRVG